MRNLFRQHVLLAALCAVSTAARADVFINEIHYDNASTDVGEAIEIVATAGEDLGQYSIVRYNGNGGAAYTTPAESGTTLTSKTCGASVSLKVISYGTDGLQNGAPDGIALVGPGSALVQFLSYEGAFAGVGGAAAGVTSTNIGVLEAGATAAGSSLQLGGTNGTTYATFAWQNEATSTFGECNNGQTFAAGADVAPTVAGTTPANAATNVAIASNLVVTFSEPVTLTGSWISLTCASSGNRTIADFAISGGPTYTLNPANDFAYGETCTATIAANSVADQDGTIDPLANDYVFSFTTGAAPVDNPPTVSAITPAAGATNVSLGTSIQVTFSEPVTTSAGAFALTCNNVAQPFAFGGSGSIYTLDPTGDLPAVTTCSVAITGAGVQDQDGTVDAMVANFLASFTTRAAGSNYYGGVDTIGCGELRSTLHATIRNHTFFPYTATSTDTWDILNTADQDPLNPANVLDIYRNESYTKISGGTGIYNREHTWPNSYGYNDRTNDEAYTDTHMLYVSNSAANSTRNNLPFDNCPPSAGCTVLTTSAYNGRGGGPSDAASYPGNHNWYSTSLDKFEVWNGRKGDVARAILYMDVRYEGGTNSSGRAEPNLIVTDNRALIQTGPSGVFQPVGYMGIRSVLLAWHQADPPDTQEQLRNDVIQSFQGNRNPFIDHPEWVAAAFPATCANERLHRDGFE